MNMGNLFKIIFLMVKIMLNVIINLWVKNDIYVKLKLNFPNYQK